ncbi:MAG: hypothetical protein ACYS47_03270 [Planctomycetota bacterium]
MRIPLFLSILFAALTGCASYKAKYDLLLGEVECVSPGEEGRTVSDIRRMGLGGVTVYLYEDDRLKLFWVPDAEELRFKLVNKTDETLKIIWDEAVYIDEKGVNNRLVHEGIRSEDAYKPQPPSLVVKKGILSQAVFPADHVRPKSRTVERRMVEPLFPSVDRRKGALKSEAQKVVGKSVRILLPMQWKDRKTEYTFTFTVKGFAIE